MALVPARARVEMNGDGLDRLNLPLLHGATADEMHPSLAIPVPAAGAAGEVLGVVRDPMAERGISTYSTVTDPPAQLALQPIASGGVRIVRTTTAMVAGTTYEIFIRASSADDGVKGAQGRVRFRAI